MPRIKKASYQARANRNDLPLSANRARFNQEVLSNSSQSDVSTIDIEVVIVEEEEEELSDFQAQQQQEHEEEQEQLPEEGETPRLIPISKKIFKLSRTPNVRDNQKTRKTKKVKKTQKVAG